MMMIIRLQNPVSSCVAPSLAHSNMLVDSWTCSKPIISSHSRCWIQSLCSCALVVCFACYTPLTQCTVVAVGSLWGAWRMGPFSSTSSVITDFFCHHSTSMGVGTWKFSFMVAVVFFVACNFCPFMSYCWTPEGPSIMRQPSVRIHDLLICIYAYPSIVYCSHILQIFIHPQCINTCP